MPSKDYLNYKPLIEEEKKEKKVKNVTGFVTKSSFELQFGFEYPKVYQKPRHIEPIKYPKLNGKSNRFR